MTTPRRGARSLWTFGTGVTFTVLTTGLSFVITPFVLRWLGAERFGIQRALMDSVAYLGLFELGLLGATRANLALHYGRGDRARAHAVALTALRRYAPIVLCMSVAGAAIVWWAPRLGGHTAISGGELRSAAAIFVVAVLLAPFSVFRAALEAQQRAYVLKALGIGGAIASGLLSLLFAYAGWGLTGQAVAVLIVPLITAPLVMLAARRELVGSWNAAPEPAAAEALTRLSRPTLVYEISSRVGLFSDNIVVAMLLAPQLVAPFFLTQRVAMIALGQLQEIGNATWAALIELHAQGLTAVFRHRLLHLSSWVTSASIILLVPVLLLNRSFIVLWLGERNYAGPMVTILVCANVWLWAVSSLWGWVVFGAGCIAAWTPYAVAFSAVNITVSLAATWWLGIYGPLLGTTAAFLFVTSWAMPGVLQRLFGVARRDLYAAIARPFAWGAPYAGAMAIAVSTIHPTTWIALAASAGLCVAAGGTCWWFVGLKDADRQVWIAETRSAIAPVF